MAPAAKRAKPVPRHLCSKGFNALEITWNSIIVQKPLDNRTEPLTHLGDGIVESAPELELHFLKLATKPLGYRLSLDREALPLTGGCTDVSKTEEIESLGLTQGSPFPACSSMTSELNEPCFLGVQAKAELAQPLLQIPKKPIGFPWVLKPHDEVISVSNYDDSASGIQCSPLMYPQIKDIMQVYIGEHGRDYRTLWGSHFRSGPDAIFRDPCPKPFPDKTQKSLVGNSVFEKLHQPSVFDGVEKAADVCIEHPIGSFLRDPNKESVQRLVRATSRSESVGETQEIFLVDSIEDRYHTLLGNLVLQGSNAQRTKFAVCLADVSSFGRLSMVGSTMNALVKIRQALLQTIFVLLPCHTVYPGRCLTPERMEAFPKEVHRDMV